MTAISPPYDLPGLRPFRTIQNRMRLQGGAVITQNGSLESEDFQTLVSGWLIDGQGNAEFNDLLARGVISIGTTGSISSTGGIQMPASDDDAGHPSEASLVAQAMTWYGRASDIVAQIVGAEIYVGAVQFSAGTYLYGKNGMRYSVDAGDHTFEDAVGTWTPFTAWPVWSPTWTNFTKGTGSEVAVYKRIGATIHFRYSLVWSATSTFTGIPTLSLPVTADAAGYQTGAAHFLDSGTKEIPGSYRISPGGTTLTPYHGQAAGSGNLTDTLPFTWVAGDLLIIQGTYEA